MADKNNPMSHKEILVAYQDFQDRLREYKKTIDKLIGDPHAMILRDDVSVDASALAHACAYGMAKMMAMLTHCNNMKAAIRADYAAGDVEDLGNGMCGLGPRVDAVIDRMQDCGEEQYHALLDLMVAYHNATGNTEIIDLTPNHIAKDN